MAGEPEGEGRHGSSRSKRLWRAVWRGATWEPTSWAGALAQALVLGTLLVALGLWAGALSLDEHPAVLLWWPPLWVAASLAGFAHRRRGARARGHDAYRGRPAGS